jgi:CBS domain containing-hemolysin-like protein
MTESAFDLRVEDIARPAIFESETATVERVVQVMRENHTHMIVLSDESGALAGLVTLEDIIEEIFGSLLSESGTDRGVTKELNGETSSLPIEVDGRVLLVDLSKQLDVDLTGVAASTVGGLILEHSRRFLEKGEGMEYANLRFTVIERDDRRLTKIEIDYALDERPDEK